MKFKDKVKEIVEKLKQFAEHAHDHTYEDRLNLIKETTKELVQGFVEVREGKKDPFIEICDIVNLCSTMAEEIVKAVLKDDKETEQKVEACLEFTASLALNLKSLKEKLDLTDNQ